MPSSGVDVLRLTPSFQIHHHAPGYHLVDFVPRRPGEIGVVVVLGAC